MDSIVSALYSSNDIDFNGIMIIANISDYIQPVL